MYKDSIEEHFSEMYEEQERREARKSNVVSMESKLEVLEKQLLDAEWIYGIRLEEYDVAMFNLERATDRLTKALAAMEGVV